MSVLRTHKRRRRAFPALYRELVQARSPLLVECSQQLAGATAVADRKCGPTIDGVARVSENRSAPLGLLSTLLGSFFLACATTQR
jgi:hypothetical protein